MQTGKLDGRPRVRWLSSAQSCVSIAERNRIVIVSRSYAEVRAASSGALVEVVLAPNGRVADARMRLLTYAKQVAGRRRVLAKIEA
mgnify:FL=1